MKTIAVRDTGKHADCVESCPIEKHEDVMVVGTYHLQKHSDGQEDTRNGDLQVYSIQQDADMHIQVHDPVTFEMSSGIFDIKWCHRQVQEKILIAAATAIGTLDIMELHQVRPPIIHY